METVIGATFHVLDYTSESEDEGEMSRGDVSNIISHIVRRSEVRVGQGMESMKHLLGPHPNPSVSDLGCGYSSNTNASRG